MLRSSSPLLKGVECKLKDLCKIIDLKYKPTLNPFPAQEKKKNKPNPNANVTFPTKFP